MRIYVDSSAYVKLYGKSAFEKGVGQVEKIVSESKSGKHVLSSSYWLIPEALASIDSWERRRYITRDEKKKSVAQLLENVEEGLNNGFLAFLGLKPETYATPGFLYLVSEEHMTPGDALHIYTATLLKPEVFVTADLGQLRVAKSHGLDVFNPEKEVWK